MFAVKGRVVTAEDVKEMVRAYAEQQFDGECGTAAVVFDVCGRSETLLVALVSRPSGCEAPSVRPR